MGDRRGQNTIEYILLLATILLFLVTVLSPAGFFSKAIEGSLNSMAEGTNSILESTW